MTDTIPEGKRVIVWRQYYLNARRKRGFRTICEVLREVYHTAEERGDAVTMTKMDEATDMAKRMHSRLEEYAGHAGHARMSLLHFDVGYVWVSKDRIFELSDAEVVLLNANRAKKAKRAAKQAKREAKGAAAIDVLAARKL